jgi:UPF0176 protein
MEARNIAFYKFIKIEEPQGLCEKFLSLARSLGLKGTLLIAVEGINGMLAGSEKNIKNFETELKNDSRFSDILIKASYSKKIPFQRLRVKVKDEILTLGLPEINPAKENIPYIKPKELKKALDEGEDLVLVDIRNDFEVNHGTFDGAINPHTKSFSEFPEFAKNLKVEKEKRIVTFCTGGIRCEKGAVILRKAGFKNVFQLEGGILEYFSSNNGAPHFSGKCFVFDERELLNPDLRGDSEE